MEVGKPPEGKEDILPDPIPIGEAIDIDNDDDVMFEE
jgi:hypothetical protein